LFALHRTLLHSAYIHHELDSLSRTAPIYDQATKQHDHYSTQCYSRLLFCHSIVLHVRAIWGLPGKLAVLN